MIISSIYGKLIIVAFTVICAYQDIRTRSIDIRVFLAMGFAEAMWYLYAVSWEVEIDIISAGLGALIGLVLYIISRLTRGSIGAGDAIFFALSGIALGLMGNVIFFFATSIILSLFGLAYCLYGFVKNVDIRHKLMPMIPFAIPALICVCI